MNNALKHKIIDFDEVDEYDNLEEFNVINGTDQQPDLCENSLRRELELPLRVSHKSIPLQSVIDRQYLTRLAELSLNGNLSLLILSNKINPGELINSNAIEACIKNNNIQMLKCITNFLLKCDKNYGGQLLEIAIEFQNAPFLTELINKGVSIETEIGMLPAKKPIFYFLEEISTDNDRFLEALLSLNPELNIFNAQQKSLLEIAFEKDMSSCFQLLISKHPDLLTLKNPQGKTIQRVIEESSAENRGDFLAIIKSATTSEEIPDIEDFL